MNMLEIKNLYGGYGNQFILQDISLAVKKGELFGILGPNGSGKTTLLKMISRILSYQKGSITIKGRPLQSFSTKELAQIMAILSQHSSEAFSYTVKETVSLGRYAHQKGLFKEWGQRDEEIVQNVMNWTGVAELQQQSIQFLSGGERQRVFLAQALAQEPEILLLDEPTNHLDLSYQKELFDLLKKWTQERGLTVISIFHDLNLAALYCDRLLLLENGKTVSCGIPDEVLRRERVENVYRTKIARQSHPKVAAPQIMLLPERNTIHDKENMIDNAMVKVKEDIVVVEAPVPLRTMSSGVIGAGAGWHKTFVNRHVDRNYYCSDHRQEMADFLRQKGFEPSETVGMMTAVKVEDVVYRFYEQEDWSALFVVTAGVGNAVDVANSHAANYPIRQGTINSWIFINGELTDEAFIQAIMTATEAKVKVLFDLGIKDPQTGTIATGTSTDSILVAASQRGKPFEFAGTITPLGKMIGKGMYECIYEAIGKSSKRKEGARC